jgi:DNA-binding transcriptional MerR regulator
MGTHASFPDSERDTYRIGEVASLTQIEPHVLRYWETEFPALHPTKTPSGQRLYSRADIETVLTIKRLLYEEGFTIAGARKQLENDNGHSLPAAPPASARPRTLGNDRPLRESLLSIREELVALLTLLSRR